MKKILFITANPKRIEQSFGLTIAEFFKSEIESIESGVEITHLDLFKANPPTLDETIFNAWEKLHKGQELSEVEISILDRLNEFLDQFIAANHYVFVTPMWNFSVPPVLKAYLDILCVAGKTFKHTDKGTVGLLKNRKAVHIHARGNIHEEKEDFADRYLRKILEFVGVTDVQSLIIEGTNQFPQKAEQIKNKAKEKAKLIAQEFVGVQNYTPSP